MLVLAAVAALVFTVDWLSQRRRAPVLVTAPAVSSPILPPGVTPAPNLGATGAPQPQLETSKLAARPAPAPAPAVPASPSPVVQSRRARAERPAAPAGEVNVAPAAAGDDIRKRFYTEAPDGP
jgi:hypothetical protein